MIRRDFLLMDARTADLGVILVENAHLQNPKG